MDSGNLMEPRALPALAQAPAVEYTIRPPFAGYPQTPSPVHEFSLLDLWRTLLKRRWMVLSVLAMSLVMTAIFTLRMTPVYEAQSRIAIFRESQNRLGLGTENLDGVASDDFDYTIAIDTQIKILQSDVLALEVIRKLKLDANPAFSDSAPAAGTAESLEAKSDPAREAALIYQFKRGLSVQTMPRTRVVTVAYSHTNPRLAAEIANAVVAEHIEQNFRTRYESTMQASDFLQKQLADLQMKVEESQSKLVEYQRKTGMLGVDEKQNIVTAKLDELNRQLTLAETERIQKEAQYRLVKQGDADMISKSEPSSLLDKLREQESDLSTQLAQAATRFGPSYPKVLELGNQLKQVQATIQAEIRKIGRRIENEYLSAVSRERMLRVALDLQKGEANKLNESAIDYTILKREADANRDLYDNLQKRLKEAGVAAGLQSSNIRVVDVARVPTSPAKPNVPRNLALAFILGLTGGVASAFTLELLDNAVRTPDHAHSVAALPTLAVIPNNAQAFQPRAFTKLLPASLTKVATAAQADAPTAIITYTRPKSEVAEAYRALRTSILLSTFGTPPKVILLTSSLPQEGKTTTSINTAITLAQKGGKVLLVDADMRRPSVHRALNIRQRGGLSTLLSGSHSQEAVITPSRQLPNLFVLPAGPVPPHPAELLGSHVMKEYLSRWREEFDHVVIDTPPTLSVTDAVMLSVMADAVLIVTRAGSTKKLALRRTRDLLAQVNARVLGIVLNAVNVNEPDHYYSSYYYGSKETGVYYDEAAGVAQ